METIRVGIKFRPVLDSDQVKDSQWSLKPNKIKSKNGKYSVPFGKCAVKTTNFSEKLNLMEIL